VPFRRARHGGKMTDAEQNRHILLLAYIAAVLEKVEDSYLEDRVRFHFRKLKELSYELYIDSEL